MAKFFGCARYVYNWALNLKSETYKETKTNISYYELHERLIKMKSEQETMWLKECNAQVLQHTLRNLDVAYNNFFRGNCNYPQFKKKSNKQSISYPQGVKIETNKVFLPKVGWVKFDKSRDIVGRIKTCTVSKTPTDKYYISILCEIITDEAKKERIRKETAVGIDLGIKSFAVTSDGEVFENQKIPP